jgi:diaminopropionate ammonia-lyase
MTAFSNPMRREIDVGEPPTEPLAFHRRMPGYQPTPLRDCAGVAAELGLGRAFVKDESARLGLPSFKILGASWATYRVLAERLAATGSDVEPWSTIDELADRIAPLRPLTLATATDGNHGRAVARMAKLLGLGCRIWVPDNTAAARIDAIASEGAKVIVAKGGYDDAVHEAAEAVQAVDPTGHETVLVSDTAWDGYTRVPEWVIDGYSTIFSEIDDQLGGSDAAQPHVVIVPIGVGALAAAVVTHYRARHRRILLVGVEPDTAACVVASVEAGRVVSLAGEQHSIMAGLNCGTPSPVAWPRISAGLDWLVTVSDEQARDAMRALARDGIVAGESGAASLAALSEALEPLTAAGAVGPWASVLLLSTEGATDPVAYRAIVGHDPRS